MSNYATSDLAAKNIFLALKAEVCKLEINKLMFLLICGEITIFD